MELSGHCSLQQNFCMLSPYLSVLKLFFNEVLTKRKSKNFAWGCHFCTPFLNLNLNPDALLSVKQSVLIGFRPEIYFEQSFSSESQNSRFSFQTRNLFQV